MDTYLLYIVVAIATISLPGPAVMLTINNAIQRGFWKAISGIFGVAIGIFCIALLSATGIGVILEQSRVAFTLVKFIGAAYLIYLGIKMLRAKPSANTLLNMRGTTYGKCFFEGFLVSTSNPKAIIFFVSILPQFIASNESYIAQLITLALTFGVLVVLIHCVYTLLAVTAKSRFMSRGKSSWLNKVSGGVFVSFGIGLAATSR
ncbi:homoserine/homoserine lactone efflux protein [Pseudoalteromonas citrea]|uniref:Homoserine/homoserine lactone efflux protein n=2 Tax=Pseudoalteromonas citrea TaxID=43655 RepID=A0AAD4AIT5_9GAMM|nr:LysE family translocator [Pseudoalteromonas citrea]KAF7771522.1 homoserine/homoserine lactone efflux protein [Pseudoalteromonas citrea]